MGKNIVICCDGTGNEISQDCTNIIEIYRIMHRNIPKQTTFYDAGVGTCRAKVDNSMGNAFGWGLQKNIEDAYRFLMDKYEDGDKVFLFGFSRGAHTARCLAGMIYKCGLLYSGSDNLVEYASKIYNNRKSTLEAQKFKDIFCRPVPIHFIGVFDSVAALGWLYGKRFFDATLNPDISYGYHALSIDEKRSKFKPSLWDENKKSENQTIEQVWFAGVHSDVGGGYPEKGLSNVALKWMLEKAKECGLLINEDEFSQVIPDQYDKINKSYVKWWKILGKSIRKIPEGARIHQSVFDRKEKELCNYNPPNSPADCNIVN